MEESLSKWVENTVGKGEIARHEQFLLFPQCFQKACFPVASKGVIVLEWVNPSHNKKWTILIIWIAYYHTVPHFDAPEKYIAVENIVRKGEIACNKQFLLFSLCFLPYMPLILSAL